MYDWTNVLHILQRCTAFIHSHITLPTSVTHVHHTRNNNVLYMHTQTPQTTNVHHNHNITHCNVVLHIQHIHNSSNHRRIPPPNTAHYNNALPTHTQTLHTTNRHHNCLTPTWRRSQITSEMSCHSLSNYPHAIRPQAISTTSGGERE